MTNRIPYMQPMFKGTSFKCPFCNAYTKQSWYKLLFNNGYSSEKLTKALNRITLAGVIIAGLGILVAVASLIFEIYKTFFIK